MLFGNKLNYFNIEIPFKVRFDLTRFTVNIK